MEPTGRYKKKAPTRGGARPGAGRPKGTSPRYTLEELMSSMETHLGVSFAERVSLNYLAALNRSDWSGVRDYDKILLGKMVADLQAVEVTDTSDQVEQQQAAFEEALQRLQALSQTRAK